MLRDELKNLVGEAIERLVAADKLPVTAREIPVEISDTKNPEHGDYACNFALVATKKVGIPPRQIGELLREALNPSTGSTPSTESTPHAFDAIDVAGPGFINLRLNPAYVASFIGSILEKGTDYIRPQHPIPNTQRLNVEFVSVNPNGPITVGSGRGAAFGSTLCNVLAAAGHEVHREYYINDGVNSEQMRLFAESVNHYILDGINVVSTFPEKGYRGEYVKQVAEQAAISADRWANYFERKLLDVELDEDFDRKSLDYLLKDPYGYESTFNQPNIPAEKRALRHSIIDLAKKHRQIQDSIDASISVKQLMPSLPDVLGEDIRFLPLGAVREIAQDLMLERQREDLSLFGVEFDTWFSEQSLHDRGIVAQRVEELEAKGVADTDPHRTVLKMGKNGKIEDVLIEEQPVEELDEEDQADGSEPNTQYPIPNTSTLWLRSTKFGDDKDRVLRRKDGRLTYIASDIAYHADKFNRPPNADKLITILGPDHHGYIGRLHAVLAALLEKPQDGVTVLGSYGVTESDPSAKPQHHNTATPLSDIEAKIYRSPEERDACLAALKVAEEKLEVVIFQIVRFVKDGKPAPMRKRDGNIYELRDLVNELGASMAPNADKQEQQRIGRDVARFFYLTRSHDTHLDFDIDLATKQSEENPIFYAQYAHARICSVLRKAEEAGITVIGSYGVTDEKTATPQHRNTELLTDRRESALIKKILDLPMEVARCAEDYGVHRLTTYAVELARTFHHFYDACRVIQPDQPDLTRARLALCEASRIALKATFDLLGVSAPESMERTDQGHGTQTG